jgi:copper(I)-binding protein
MAGGIMRMRKLHRLPLPARAPVKLEPGGTHVMLTGLREPLVAGGNIELRLRFEKSGERTVAVRVGDPQ